MQQKSKLLKTGKKRGRPSNAEKAKSQQSQQSQQQSRKVFSDDKPGTSPAQFECAYCKRDCITELGKRIHEGYCASKTTDQAEKANQPEATQDSQGIALVQPAQTSEASKGEITLQVLEIAVRSSFDTLASIRGEHWRLSADQAKTLAGVWKPVIDHYAPKVGSSVWAPALLPTLLILGPIVFVELRKNAGNKSGDGKQGSGPNDRDGRQRENNEVAA